jgi:lipid II:glycine glycyltransferase (peptidoglycan interpeptide bridge formation enzyme)
MILWEAIKYGKEHGMRVFDLCGIDLPEKENESLPPLTVYKESFGGRRVQNYYYGKIYSPWLKIFRAAKKFFRL